MSIVCFSLIWTKSGKMVFSSKVVWPYLFHFLQPSSKCLLLLILLLALFVEVTGCGAGVGVGGWASLCGTIYIPLPFSASFQQVLVAAYTAPGLVCGGHWVQGGCGAGVGVGGWASLCGTIHTSSIFCKLPASACCCLYCSWPCLWR